MGERGAPFAYSRNCQTFTATPAEPGDLPGLLDFVYVLSHVPHNLLLVNSVVKCH
jgi:hypothetical protein